MNDAAQTKREQVEAVLRERGFQEEAPGDWFSQATVVYLDIRHAPDTAWIREVIGDRLGPKTVLTYDELLARFG